MIPFANFAYFGILLYAVIPTVALGIAGRANRRWAFLVTLAFFIGEFCTKLHVSLHASLPTLAVVTGYVGYEWAIAIGFLHARRRSKSSAGFHAVLLFALAPLAATKFVPLLAPGDAFGFLGISYVTFRVLDVLFCIHDGLITSLPPSQFFAYTFFFATLSSGPIDRYRRFDKDWKRTRTRVDFLVDLDAAIERIFRGFLYKFILATLIKRFWVDRVTGESLGETVSYMYGYSLYLFFDFAGYSAFAIGLSRLFGIHTPENFDRPFLAHNIRDFWNRWHITLSFWFRDHVYMRFLLAATKGKWFKSDRAAAYVGLLLSFGLMGLWHGTGLHYLIYGAYHACLLIAYDSFSRWNRQKAWWGTGRWWRAASILVTSQAVCFGFLIFSGRLGP